PRRSSDLWHILEGDQECPLDISSAHRHGSRTRYVEDRRIVVLGADVEPISAPAPRSRMSAIACLSHELAHAQRDRMRYNRPTGHPDMLLDEAEASIHASFNLLLSARDREDLIEDARDRLIDWLANVRQRG